MKKIFMMVACMAFVATTYAPQAEAARATRAKLTTPLTLEDVLFADDTTRGNHGIPSCSQVRGKSCILRQPRHTYPKCVENGIVVQCLCDNNNVNPTVPVLFCNGSAVP